MLNLTLTITAAPELLAAMSNFTRAITSARVVTVPLTESEVSTIKEFQMQIPSSNYINQPIHQAGIYPVQNPAVQNITQIQQPDQGQALQSITPGMTQPLPQSVTTTFIQSAQQSVPISGVPLQQQVPVGDVPAQQMVPNQTPPSQASVVPTSAPTYTMDQLAVAATQLVDAGRRNELVALLQSFGIQALTALPKERYGEFATQLRTLGAKIDNLYVQKGNTEGVKIDNLYVQQRNAGGIEIDNLYVQQRNAGGVKV